MSGKLMQVLHLYCVHCHVYDAFPTVAQAEEYGWAVLALPKDPSRRGPENVRRPGICPKCHP